MPKYFRVSLLSCAPAVLALASLAAAQPAPEAPPAAPDTQGPAPAPAPAPDTEPGAPPGEAPPRDAATEPPAEPGAPGEAGPPPPVEAEPPGSFGVSAWPDQGSDAEAEEKHGSKRPEATPEAGEDQVFAEDWWGHTRPMLEIGGYFRVRAELFHKFSLDRFDTPTETFWPRPADDGYQHNAQDYGPRLCTDDESGRGSDDSADNAKEPCRNNTQSGANMRFRVTPQLLISDNLRVISQIDMLDNLVLGSTPEGYSNSPAGQGGYEVNPRGGYTPTSLDTRTQAPPSDGDNSTTDSIVVKRAWAEYSTPMGQLKFGRMPSHWGLGIFQNAGDGYDDDYQSTVDRLAFVTGLKAYDIYFAGAWDFAAEGPTSASFSNPQEQPYDLAQLDDVDEYVLAIFRKRSPALERLDLAKGKLVLNGGIYFMYQQQLLANDRSGTCDDDYAASLDCEAGDAGKGYNRRGARMFIPDLWLQLKYKKFRFEAEAITVQGRADGLETLNTGKAENEDWKYRQYGVATEIEQKLVEDKLRLGFDFGWASGDEDVETFGSQQQLGDSTISTYRFHPSYHIDLILHRHLLERVQGTYYFRPNVEYDFIRDSRGQKLGGGVAAIWTRADEFMQTPGHERDLGVELNASLYFQSKDGSLNDDPNQMGGFFSMLQYGVFFPMGGMGYLSEEARNLEDQDNIQADLSSAQTLRLYLGVLF